MAPPRSSRRNKSKNQRLELGIRPSAEARKMMGTSFREYLLHEDDLKRHVNLAVRQRILRDTTNPFELEEDRFRQLYRFDRASVQQLIVETSRYIETPQVPIMIRVFAALHFFAHGTFQSDFAKVFPKNQLENVIMVADGLQKLAQLWVKFPKADEYDAIKECFFTNTGFPGVVGAIDCHQIRMKKPKDEKIRAQYENCEGYYSMNVQLICDFNLKILDSASAHGGATKHDEIWEKNRINAILQHRYRINKTDESWLLGDSRYKLCPWVLVPYRPVTNETELLYNKLHGQTRNCTYRLIRTLKSQFRCLTEIDAAPPQARKIIDACIVLHNMLVDRNLIQPNAHEEINYVDEPPCEHNRRKEPPCWQTNEGVAVRDRAKDKIVANTVEIKKEEIQD